MIVLHHAGEGLLHGARLIHFADQKEKTSKGKVQIENFIWETDFLKLFDYHWTNFIWLSVAFMFANSIFITARILSVLTAALVFIYGLSKVDSTLSFGEGKFNIPAVRFSAAAAVLVFQFYMLYVFLKYQYKRARENGAPVSSSKSKAVKPRPKKKEGMNYLW